jgi:hypothetical protein
MEQAQKKRKVARKAARLKAAAEEKPLDDGEEEFVVSSEKTVEEQASLLDETKGGDGAKGESGSEDEDGGESDADEGDSDSDDDDDEDYDAPYPTVSFSGGLSCVSCFSPDLPDFDQQANGRSSRPLALFFETPTSSARRPPDLPLLRQLIPLSFCLIGSLTNFLPVSILLPNERSSARSGTLVADPLSFIRPIATPVFHSVSHLTLYAP